MARAHTMAIKKAVASKQWQLAVHIAVEEMGGTHGRNWLRRIERLREEDQTLLCANCGHHWAIHPVSPELQCAEFRPKQ